MSVIGAYDNLLAARHQMAFSLGFHIILSCFGVAFPAMIFVAHRRGLRGDPEALLLARHWSKAAAVLFAVGAVSGTVLSFEMGLLWPGLMSTYGDVIGLAFALEGIAFFLEAIFIGIYLFGWDRLPPRLHLATLVPMIVSGAAGTFCILTVNSWMNSPTGFTRLADGTITDIDPVKAMFNPAMWVMFLHMWVATFAVTGFLVAAVYAAGLLKGRHDRYHRVGLAIPLIFAGTAAFIQPVIGHFAGQRLVEAQPSKLAAMELNLSPRDHAPEIIGGVIIDGEVRYGIPLPGVSSFLAGDSFDTVVPGLDQFPEDEQPPANIVHLAFQAMVGAGMTMMAITAWWWWRRRRHGEGAADNRWMLRALVVAGPLAVIALEAGWITTEVGRQPWIVYGHMKVSEAVTQNDGVRFTFLAVVVLYALMGFALVKVLRGMAARWRLDPTSNLQAPYGPSSPGGSGPDLEVRP